MWDFSFFLKHKNEVNGITIPVYLFGLTLLLDDAVPLCCLGFFYATYTSFFKCLFFSFSTFWLCSYVLYVFKWEMKQTMISKYSSFVLLFLVSWNSGFRLFSLFYYICTLTLQLLHALSENIFLLFWNALWWLQLIIGHIYTRISMLFWWISIINPFTHFFYIPLYSSFSISFFLFIPKFFFTQLIFSVNNNEK